MCRFRVYPLISAVQILKRGSWQQMNLSLPQWLPTCGKKIHQQETTMPCQSAQTTKVAGLASMACLSESAEPSKG